VPGDVGGLSIRLEDNEGGPALPVLAAGFHCRRVAP
jgi:hypothetical protein